jgi:transposase
MDPPAVRPARFVGIDLHKTYLVLAAVDAEQQVVRPPRRLALAEFEASVATHLRPTDAVVLEATGNAWHLHDRIRPLVASVTVAHPLLVRLITAARVKTDARDSVRLARLLAADLVPAVWVPPPAVRELRALVAHRRRLVGQRTQTRNRLHAVLHRHDRLPPPGDPFARGQRAWWDALELVPSERLRVRQDLALLDALAPLLAEVEAELLRQSTTSPWAEQTAFLVQLPGIGVLTAMVLLGAVGEVGRFPSAKRLVGYSGLGASVHASGQTHRAGGITKQGRRELRAAMVEAAWVAVRQHPHWRAEFARLTRRLDERKAVVAVARKLLVAVWHVLTDRVADRHADSEAVARKLMVWAARGGTARRTGVSRGAFVRRQLTRLDLGAELTTLRYGSDRVRLPPPDSAATVPRPDGDQVAVETS